ncbi:MAG: hypothetical protein ACR2KJ_08335 [Jatrophihabitans sp.]
MSVHDDGAPAESPLTDELAELLTAAQGWVGRAAASHQVATGAPECTGCPLCQLVSVLRGDRPEVTEKVLDVVTTMVTGLRAAFDRPPGTDVPDDEAASASRLQPIDLTDPEED